MHIYLHHHHHRTPNIFNAKLPNQTSNRKTNVLHVFPSRFQLKDQVPLGDLSLSKWNKVTEGPAAWGKQSIYKGEYEDGLRHGQGREQWQDGIMYEGSWAYGLKDGLGYEPLSHRRFVRSMPQMAVPHCALCKWGRGSGTAISVLSAW